MIKMMWSFTSFFQVHRLVMVDDENHVVGVVSLSDLLNTLVLKPAGIYGKFVLLATYVLSAIYLYCTYLWCPSPFLGGNVENENLKTIQIQ